MNNINSWKNIQWKIIEEKVFYLQLRIYKAATNQEYEKMYKLQKILIKSKSAKFLSVRKVTQDNDGKRIPGVDNVLIKTPSEKFGLSNQLRLDGKSSPIKHVFIKYSDGKFRPLGIPTIQDRAKQMLAYLAFCPQWEASFEASSYGFRPGRSIDDAMEALFLEISKKSKWILNANISKSLDKINHQYLIEKCNTFPDLLKQIRAWLEVGILDGEQFAFPEIGTPEGGVILPLLVNIILHGLREHLDNFINRLRSYSSNYIESFTYIRYADNFILMHPNGEILKNLEKETSKFLKPIGLKLDPIRTKKVHTLKNTEEFSMGFSFLDFDIIQYATKVKQIKIRSKNKKGSKRGFITLITPSKESIKKHKQKLRKIIHSYRGVDQKRLIQLLNPVIRKWAYSKRSQMASKVFQDLDTYLWLLLWKWCRYRHRKMSKIKLKEKYWHVEGKRNWIFGIKNNSKIQIRLQIHSKILIKRHLKVKDNASPFDGNSLYWADRAVKSLSISSKKARLIRKQKGQCAICKRYFLPDDIIQLCNSRHKAIGYKNLTSNIYVAHYYCHLSKTV